MERVVTLCMRSQDIARYFSGCAREMLEEMEGQEPQILQMPIADRIEIQHGRQDNKPEVAELKTQRAESMGAVVTLSEFLKLAHDKVYRKLEDDAYMAGYQLAIETDWVMDNMLGVAQRVRAYSAANLNPATDTTMLGAMRAKNLIIQLMPLEVVREIQQSDLRKRQLVKKQLAGLMVDDT